MKFGSDNDTLLFYPECDMDLFSFGKMVGRHGLNYTIDCHVTEGKIERFELKGKDIYSYLLLPDGAREEC